MWIGHAAPAFFAKPTVPSVSLGALFVAVGLADALCFTFALFGIETFRFNPAKVGALPYDFINPYTHSMIGMMGFGAVYTAFYLFILRNESFGGNTMKRAAVIMALVASHWFLEIPVHRTVLDGVQIWIKDTVRYGWSLFDYQLAENALELGLLLPAIAFYAAYTKQREGAIPWYARLDYFTGILVFSQLFVCAAPRFVYETVPDTIMTANAVLLIAAHSWQADQVDKHREVLSQPKVNVKKVS